MNTPSMPILLRSMDNDSLTLLRIDTVTNLPMTKTLTLTATGLTGKQWLARLKKGKYKVSSYAEDLILSDEFNKNISKKGTEFNVAIIPQTELGLGKYVTTTQIKEYAENKGWSIPTPEIALLLREALSNEDMEALGVWWIVALHEPMTDRGGDPRVLGAHRNDGEPWVHACWGYPGRQWRAGHGFAFLVPASSTEASEAQPDLGALELPPQGGVLDVMNARLNRIEAVLAHHNLHD